MPLPKRKPNRLSSFDYGQNSAYFLTACTKDKECLLWSDRFPLTASSDDISHLSAAGLAIDAAICEIPLRYPAITVEKYAVMPNHLHLLLLLQHAPSESSPDISRVMQQLKSAATKKIGRSVWQKSFHDRIVRDEKEYQAIWAYIDANPARWHEDCYYPQVE